MTKAFATVTDSAREIRQALAKQGLTSRDVSVVSSQYSGGSSLRVRIKNPNVAADRVREIATAHESIRRDGFGEILSGGNRYVSVGYDHATLAVLRDRVLPDVTAAVAQLAVSDDHSLIEIGTTAYMVGRTLNGLSLWLKDKGHQAEAWDVNSLAEILGARLAGTVAS